MPGHIAIPLAQQHPHSSSSPRAANIEPLGRDDGAIAHVTAPTSSPPVSPRGSSHPPSGLSPIVQAFKKPFIKARNGAPTSTNKLALQSSVQQQEAPLGPPPRLEHQRNGVFQTYVGALLGSETALEMLLEHTTREQVEAFIDDTKPTTGAVAPSVATTPTLTVPSGNAKLPKPAGGLLPRATDLFEGESSDDFSTCTSTPTTQEGSDWKPPFSSSLTVQENPAVFEGVDDATANYDPSTSMQTGPDERIWPTASKPWPGVKLTFTTLFPHDRPGPGGWRSGYDPHDDGHKHRNPTGSTGVVTQVEGHSSDDGDTSAVAVAETKPHWTTTLAYDTHEMHRRVFEDYIAWTHHQDFDFFDDDDDGGSEDGTSTEEDHRHQHRRKVSLTSMTSAALADSDTEGDSLRTSQVSHLSLPSAIQSTQVYFGPRAATPTSADSNDFPLSFDITTTSPSTMSQAWFDHETSDSPIGSTFDSSFSRDNATLSPVSDDYEYSGGPCSIATHTTSEMRHAKSEQAYNVAAQSQWHKEVDTVDDTRDTRDTHDTELSLESHHCSLPQDNTPAPIWESPVHRQRHQTERRSSASSAVSATSTLFGNEDEYAYSRAAGAANVPPPFKYSQRQRDAWANRCHLFDVPALSVRGATA